MLTRQLLLRLVSGIIMLVVIGSSVRPTSASTDYISIGSGHVLTKDDIRITIDGLISPVRKLDQLKSLHNVLYYALDKDDVKILHVFTTEVGWRQYIAQVQKDVQLRRGVITEGTGDSCSRFYPNASYGGGDPLIVCSPGGNAPNLWFGFWNDTISSVKTTGLGNGTFLYSDSGYKGNVMYIPAGQDRADLSIYSFNDIASSIFVA